MISSRAAKLNLAPLPGMGQSITLGGQPVEAGRAHETGHSECFLVTYTKKATFWHFCLSFQSFNFLVIRKYDTSGFHSSVYSLYFSSKAIIT